jgi:hypothetical protein
MIRKLKVLGIFDNEGNISSILNITHCENDVRDFIENNHPNIQIIIGDNINCFCIEDYLDYSGVVIENTASYYSEYFLNVRLENMVRVQIEEMELEYGDEYYFNDNVGRYYAFKNVGEEFLLYKISDEALIVRKSQFHTLDEFILKNDFSNTSMAQLNFFKKYREFTF